jgi:hypothetical protein
VAEESVRYPLNQRHEQRATEIERL